MAETRVAEVRGRWLLWAALAAPLAAAPLASRALADGLAQRTATELAALAARLPAPPLRPADPSAPSTPAGPELLPDRPAAAPSAPAAMPARAADRGRASPSKGLRIRAAVVARAARSGGRPSGTPVAASGPRPAGLVLHGVGQFGAGLRDGDVLTSVGGAPARSVDTVVGAVAGALRARAPMLGAVVWRGDEPIQVTVELPRLPDERGAPARDSEATAGSTPRTRRPR